MSVIEKIDRSCSEPPLRLAAKALFKLFVGYDMEMLKAISTLDREVHRLKGAFVHSFTWSTSD